MTTLANARSSCQLPAVPLTVVTKDRQLVNTSGSVWQFRASVDGGKQIRLNWSLLPDHAKPLDLCPSVIWQARAYLAAKMRVSKASTIRNDFSMFGRVLLWIAARARQGMEPDLHPLSVGNVYMSTTFACSWNMA